MLRFAATATAVMIVALAAMPGVATAQTKIAYEVGQVVLPAGAQTALDQLVIETRRRGLSDIQIVGHADSGESAAAAELVAAIRAEEIGRLLAAGDWKARIDFIDSDFIPGASQISVDGAVRLEGMIERRRTEGGFPLFVQPRSGASELNQVSAESVGQFFLTRGAIWIKADGDDFTPGSTSVSQVLQVEIDRVRSGVTQPAVVVQALETSLAEGSTSLTALAWMRSRIVRDYLLATGVPAAWLTVLSEGATAQDGAAGANRRVKLSARETSAW